MELPTLLLIVAIAYGVALLHSISGFAGGLFLIVLLAPILGMKETVPAAAAAMLVSNISRLWVYRRVVDWRTVGVIVGCASPGVVLGAILYAGLPVHAVAAVLSVFLFASVLLRHAPVFRTFHIGRRGLGLVGVPFGFVAGITFGAGMTLVPFLLGAGIAGERLVAVAAALGFSLNLIKTVVFGLSPALTLTLAIKGLLIGLAMVPGAYTGRWIVRRTGLRVHTAFMDLVVLAGAVHFLWTAIRGFGLL